MLVRFKSSIAKNHQEQLSAPNVLLRTRVLADCLQAYYNHHRSHQALENESCNYHRLFTTFRYFLEFLQTILLFGKVFNLIDSVLRC